MTSLGQPLDGKSVDAMPLDGVPADGALFASELCFAAVDGDGGADISSTDGAGKLRVLVVDDHADMLGLMRMMLERHSYRVETALSGEQALEVARSFAPQVVVSDIGMPGMDGYEMMLALRSMDMAPFKSIALSGYDAQQEGARAVAAGYDAQFTKPVDFEQLFQAIDAIVAPSK